MKQKYYKKLLVVVFVLIGFSLIFSSVEAKKTTTKKYYVSGGLDTTDGTNLPIAKTDLKKLKKRDNVFVVSNWFWPQYNQGNYDETKFIEYNFHQHLKKKAKIKSVILNHVYRSASDKSIENAKMEIWNGSDWSNQTNLSLPNANIVSAVDNLNLTSFINTSGQINHLKVRFLAYLLGNNTQTNHDQIILTVKYQ
jgi:hypothetical protein